MLELSFGFNARLNENGSCDAEQETLEIGFDLAQVITKYLLNHLFH